ncbi:hypothetical protein AAGF08_06070 [Algoriphagus sp. SE2]|uniref:hypothetical protein n=1 Tax=Algoriphagus sp. SE2 TaxID=3141536 RepID=UPI0031CD6131
MTEWHQFSTGTVFENNGFMKNRMNLIKKGFKFFRKITWALIVAFMLGVHNFYKQEMDSPDSIVSSIQIDAEEEDSAPKL